MIGRVRCSILEQYPSLQKVVADIYTASNTWKETNGNAATVSLKKEWQPTLTWDKDDWSWKLFPL